MGIMSVDEDLLANRFNLVELDWKLTSLFSNYIGLKKNHKFSHENNNQVLKEEDLEAVKTFAYTTFGLRYE